MLTNEASLGYLCSGSGGDLLNCEVAPVSMKAKNEVPCG